MNILDSVISELQHRKGDWVSIASDAGVSYSWLTKFANNKIPNPGFVTIDRLHKLLKKAA